MDREGNPSDHNLLFAMLAMQTDFVRREHLDQAVAAWTRERRRPLGDILCEMGVLQPDERAAIDTMVAKHLARNGNDVERTLATFPTSQTLRRELEQLSESTGDLTQAYATRTQAELVPLSVPVLRPAGPSPSADRFRIVRPHAEGGLGEVFLAHDQELHRDVALKQIKDERADHPDSRSRFVLEAEITGRLEHPGIVPVYAMGHYADGRPFYAMRFIRGDSFKAAIERFHRTGRATEPSRASGGRAAPGAPSPAGDSSKPGAQPAPAAASEAAPDASGSSPTNSDLSSSGTARRPQIAYALNNLEFRKLLGRFLEVCMAIEYAHSRGVLHRDIKPANVMLGRYGETLVVDWGLAKPIGRTANTNDSGETTLHPAAGSDSTPTIAGKAMGTPAFMSPEQAAGQVDNLEPMSDVYSLGATLYFLLTGVPAFRDRDVNVLLDKVKRGDFPRPRSVQSAVPRGLEAVCLKAMSRQPSDRYPTARALASEIEAWLADEPVAARRETLVHCLGRWTRRHRSWALAGVVSLVAVAVAAMVTVGVTKQALDHEEHEKIEAQKQRNIADAERRRADERAREAELARQDADQQKNDALLARNEAVKARKEADEKRHEAEQVAAQLRTEKEKNQQLQDTLEVANNKVRTLRDVPGIQGANVDPAEPSTVRMRELNGDIAKYEEKIRAGTATPEDARMLLWAHINLGDFVANSGGAGAVDASEEVMRQYRTAHELAQKAVAVEQPTEVARRDLSVTLSRLGDAHLQLGDVLEADKNYRAGLEIDLQLLAGHDGDTSRLADLAVSYSNIGSVALLLLRPEDAEKAFQEYFKIAQKIVDLDPEPPENQRRLATAHCNLGDVAAQRSDQKTARKEFEASLDILLRQDERKPNDSFTERSIMVAQNRVGDTLLRLGEPQRAREAFEKGLTLAERLLAAEPNNLQIIRDLEVSYHKLAALATSQRDYKVAMTWYRKALEGTLRRVKLDPVNANTQRDLKLTYTRMGETALNLEDLKLAREFFELGLKISQATAERDPGNVQAQRDLSVSYNLLGEVCYRAGDDPAALGYFQQDLEVALRLLAEIPDDRQRLRDVRSTRDALAKTYMHMNKFEQARDEYQKSLEIMLKLAAASPDDVATQRELEVAYNQLGTAYSRLGDLKTAREYYLKDLEITARLADEDPRNANRQRDLRMSYAILAYVDGQAKDYARALAYAQKSTAAARLAVQLAPDDPQMQRDMTLSLRALGEAANLASDAKAAEAAYREAVDLAVSYDKASVGSTDAARDLQTSWNSLAIWLGDAGNYTAAAEAYNSALIVTERLAKAAPANTALQTDVAVALVRCGLSEMRDSEHARAIPRFERAIEIVRELDKAKLLREADEWPKWLTEQQASLENCQQVVRAVEDPNVALAEKDPQRAREMLLHQLSYQLRHGQVANVVAGGEAFRKLELERGENDYFAALAYASAANPEFAKGADGKPLADAEYEKYALEAMRSLRDARGKGFFSEPRRLNGLRNHSELSVLRQREDFKQFLAEVEKESAQADKPKNL